MSVVKEGLVPELVRRYESDPGMLIPMMQDLQAEYGYLPPEELKKLAAELGVPLSRVYGVAMFYSSFRLSPKGQHEVTLCMGTVCYLKGAPKISEAICAEYGIKPGGTTADHLFTLQAVNCVGACALAPVMIVDGKYYDGVTPDSALGVLRKLGENGGAEDGEPAAPPQAPAVAPSVEPPLPVAQAPQAPAPQPAARAKPGPQVKARPAKARPAAKPKAKADAKPAAKSKPAAKAKPAARAKGKAAGQSAAKKRSRP